MDESSHENGGILFEHELIWEEKKKIMLFRIKN